MRTGLTAQTLVYWPSFRQVLDVPNATWTDLGGAKHELQQFILSSRAIRALHYKRRGGAPDPHFQVYSQPKLL